MCLPPSLSPASRLSSPTPWISVILTVDPKCCYLSARLFSLTCSPLIHGYFMWTFTPLCFETHRFLDYNMHEMLCLIFLDFMNGTLLFLSQLHIEAYTIVNPTSNLTLVGIAVQIVTIPARLQICHKHCHTGMLTTSFLVKLQVLLYIQSMLFFICIIYELTLNLICTLYLSVKLQCSFYTFLVPSVSNQLTFTMWYD